MKAAFPDLLVAGALVCVVHAFSEMPVEAQIHGTLTPSESGLEKPGGQEDPNSPSNR